MNYVSEVESQTEDDNDNNNNNNINNNNYDNDKSFIQRDFFSHFQLRFKIYIIM